MLSESQLAERRYRLGASEIAAIFNDNPYCTQFELFARKTGRYVEDIGSPAIEIGNLVEPGLLDRIAKIRGKGIIRNREERYASGLPIVATLDAMFEDYSYVIEAKTGNIAHVDFEALKKWTADSFPRWYWWQIQTQMICAGINRGILTALVGGLGIRDYEVELDRPKLVEALGIAVEWWDNHIVLDTPPDILPIDFEILKKCPEPSEYEIAELPDRFDDLVTEYQSLTAEHSLREARIKEIKAEVGAAIGLASVGVTPKGVEIPFRERPRKGFTVAPSKPRVLEIPR